MTVVSTKEFHANQDRYLDMALDEQIFVKRGDYMFHINCSNFDTVTKPQAISEPDDDLRRAITTEELIKRIQEDKRRNYASRV